MSAGVVCAVFFYTTVFMHHCTSSWPVGRQDGFANGGHYMSIATVGRYPELLLVTVTLRCLDQMLPLHVNTAH